MPDPIAPICSAVVLAGGTSRRFGSDKLTATVAGVPLWDLAVRSARALTSDVIVVGREHPVERWTIEPGPRLGPLNAVRHGLGQVEHETVIVIAGDQPSIEPRLLRFMVDELGDADVVVPIDRSGRAQPLVAVYRRRLVAAMTEALSRGERSLVRFLETVGTRWLAPEVWEPFDPLGQSFRDIDTPGDLLLHNPEGGPSSSGSTG